jgi:hypothetical protein
MIQSHLDIVTNWGSSHQHMSLLGDTFYPSHKTVLTMVNIVRDLREIK